MFSPRRFFPNFHRVCLLEVVNHYQTRNLPTSTYHDNSYWVAEPQLKCLWRPKYRQIEVGEGVGGCSIIHRHIQQFPCRFYPCNHTIDPLTQLTHSYGKGLAGGRGETRWLVYVVKLVSNETDIPVVVDSRAFIMATKCCWYIQDYSAFL